MRIMFSQLMSVRWQYIVSVVILVVTSFMKLQSVRTPENVKIPTQSLPSPNGYDYFVAAAEQVPDAEFFEQCRYLSHMSMFDHRSKLPGQTAPMSQSALDRMLADDAPAIKTMRDGFKYQCVVPRSTAFPPARPFDELSIMNPKTESPVGALLLVLDFDCTVRSVEGRWSDAMREDIDDMQLTTDLGVQGDISWPMSGFNPKKSVYTLACQTVDKLGAADSRTDGQLLAKLDRCAVSYPETLEEEKWSHETCLLNLFGQDGRRHRGDFVSWPPVDLAFDFESPAEAFDDYNRYANACIAVAHLPWPERLRRGWPARQRDPINEMLGADFENDEDERATLALSELLATSLALHAYKLDHGVCPRTFAQLVPTYLPAAPLDPFSDGQPLKYRIVGDHDLLYSIGPDGVDNGGAPIPMSATALALGDSVTRDLTAKGDIVAGVNY
jgi:hypothetical protein